MNIGPKLASSIHAPNVNVNNVLIYLCNPVKYTIILEGVVENNVATIVKNSKNKTSKAFFGMDMTILKIIIS